jgi:hypothetical protein
MTILTHRPLSPLHAPDAACPCSICLMHFDKLKHPASHPDHSNHVEEPQTDEAPPADEKP